jgi:hypothetical protein
MMQSKHFTVIAATFALASGCASHVKPPAGPVAVTAQTKFEDLRGIFMAKVPSSPLPRPGGWLPLTAKVPADQVETALGVAGSDLATWCTLQRGTYYAPGATNKSEVVKNAEIESTHLWKAADMGMSSAYTQSCEVDGKVYLLSGYNIGFAWLSHDGRATKAQAAKEAEEKRIAGFAAAMKESRARAEKESQAAARSRRETEARRTAVLERSANGTQLVCTGRQSRGLTIADVWYICKGQDIGTLTFAAFSQAGWRLSSQTLVPVLMTSGNVEHDATVVFEKFR